MPQNEFYVIFIVVKNADIVIKYIWISLRKLFQTKSYFLWFNSCTEKFGCKLTKYYYYVLLSYNTHKTILSKAKQGINMTEMELANLDIIIFPLIKKGQSISHSKVIYLPKCKKDSKM